MVTNPSLTDDADRRCNDPVVTDLVTRARNGDRQAWDALVERYAPLIWSICRRHRLGDADTGDVGQSVWLKLAGQLTEITLERQEDGRLLQLARLALIVAESGRCGGPMGVAERHTCLVLRLARACSEVWPVAADRVGIWLTGSGRSRGRCTRRLTRTGSAPTRCVTWRGHLGSPGRVAPRVTGSAVATSWP